MQGGSALPDKILTEKEKFRLEYSENPDFLRLKTRSSELIQILLPSTLHLVTALLVQGLSESSIVALASSRYWFTSSLASCFLKIIVWNER